MSAVIDVARAVIQVVREVVNVVKEMSTAIFEAGQRTLVAENAYKSITGSTEAANVQFEFLRDTSKELGLNFYTLREGYKGFLAAANSSTLPMKEIQKIFKSVSNAGAILGLSNEKMSLTFLALEQMLSKGKVSMEEIRRQMGDSLPGAFQLGAKAMGMTVEAFDKAVSAGKVYSDDFLPKFSVAMDKMYVGTIADSVKAVNLLKESWEDLLVSMSKAGFMESVALAMADITDILKDPGVIASMESWAGLLGDILVLTGKLAKVGIDRMVAFTNFFKGIAEVNDYRISFGEFLFASPEELAKILAGLDQIDRAAKKAQDAIRVNGELTKEQLIASMKTAQQELDKLYITSGGDRGLYSNVGMGFDPKAFEIPEETQTEITRLTEKIETLGQSIKDIEAVAFRLKEAQIFGMDTWEAPLNIWEENAAGMKVFIDEQIAGLGELETAIIEKHNKTWAKMPEQLLASLEYQLALFKEYGVKDFKTIEILEQNILDLKTKMGAEDAAAQAKRDAEKKSAAEKTARAIADIEDRYNKLTMSELDYELLKLKTEFDALAKAADGYSDELKEIYDNQKMLIEQKYDPPAH